MDGIIVYFFDFCCVPMGDIGAPKSETYYTWECRRDVFQSPRGYNYKMSRREVWDFSRLVLEYF